VIQKIDHIGIIVKDLDKAIDVYSKALGLNVKLIECSEDFNVRIAFLPVGEVLVELLEPVGPGILQDFLNERGEGLHHICYRVADIHTAIKKVGNKLTLRDKEPRAAVAGTKIFFLDPKSIFNTETEFVERNSEI
jgi:methylmalonyl-CoA/ethylmalonyl-CoA epimerase